MTPNGLSDVHVEVDGTLVVATVSGEVDPSNARDLSRAVTAGVPNDALAVVVDLTDVVYLDSSGVQQLFELAERLAARQQKLSVAVPPDGPCRRVLDIVAFDQTAPIYDSRDEAVDAQD